MYVFMPMIHAKVNRPYSPESAEQFKADMGQAITAFPGKSEAYLMVGIEKEQLWFKGSDAPAAFVQVSVLGSLNHDSACRCTDLICESIEKHFNIPADRIYVKYDATNEWGWNGTNF